MKSEKKLGGSGGSKSKKIMSVVQSRAAKQLNFEAGRVRKKGFKR